MVRLVEKQAKEKHKIIYGEALKRFIINKTDEIYINTKKNQATKIYMF